MVIRSVNLETVCGYKSKLPKNTKPEVAFAGKSNVGKSSLINTLVNRKSFARTSSQPGKTQTINFYNVNDEMYLTDLPGYGFAKVPEQEKQKWGEMIERYLHTSTQLRAVLLLIDIRHEPSANDRTMYDWIIYQGYRPIIIATKMDKVKRSQLAKQLKAIRKGLDVEPDTIVIPFSAVTKQGRDEIWDLMEALCADEPEPDMTPDKGEREEDSEE
ncbi:MAG: ribosome biogenesis GTP-binding protein YihA/YsxC [Lachnospiraceae bacterium]|nr:ribosome biogenesis GTP-binding protein YihA/YsxC [Lachnospiraceae bacterium]